MCLMRNNGKSWDWLFEFWDPSLMDGRTGLLLGSSRSFLSIFPECSSPSSLFQLPR